MVSDRAFIETVQTSGITTHDNLVITACNGSVSIVSNSETDIVSNNIVVIEAPLIVLEGNVCLQNLMPCDPNTQINITGLNLAGLNVDLFPSSNAVGTNLVLQPFVPHMQIASLVGNGISISGPDANGDVTLSSNTSLTSAGTGLNIVVNSAGPDMSIMSFVGNGGTTITTANNTVTITSIGNINLTTPDTTGVNLVSTGQGVDLTLKSLVAGNNVTIINGLTNVIISTNSNDVTLTSVGTGTNIVADGQGPALNVKSFVGLGTTIVNANATTVNIFSASTDVTLNSAGGVNLVEQGQGPSMTIYGLASASTDRLFVANTAPTISLGYIHQYATANIAMSPALTANTWYFMGVEALSISGSLITVQPGVWGQSSSQAAVFSTSGAGKYLRGTLSLSVFMPAGDAVAMVGNEWIQVAAFTPAIPVGGVITDSLVESTKYNFAAQAADAQSTQANAGRVWKFNFSFMTVYPALRFGFLHRAPNSLTITDVTYQTETAPSDPVNPVIPGYTDGAVGGNTGQFLGSYVNIEVWS